jgi:predicted thioesterase
MIREIPTEQAAREPGRGRAGAPKPPSPAQRRARRSHEHWECGRLRLYRQANSVEGTGTMDLSSLKAGLQGSAELVVGVEHTAPRVGSGRVPVLATPVMINVIEAAALAAVEHLLPAGHQSLGIHLDVRHFAATPVGMRVSATSELIGIDGRTLRFKVEARDEREPIGDGWHERVVVNVARFDQRVQRKLSNTS